ncbi:MAG: thiazole/oxazole-forming peptide maturase SagC family component [Phenylobacterium sp.]|jgi:thiazole/oxazole-forming peptide maturase SagC family component
MEYFLHPSVNITIISAVKIQISSIQNSITVEDQNTHIDTLTRLLRDGLNFPEALEALESVATLMQIFEFLKDNAFLTTEKWQSGDAMPEDLKLLVTEYDYAGKSSGLDPELEVSSVNLMGSGELFNRVRHELTALKFNVNCNPLPDALLKGMIVCCYDQPNLNFFEEINLLSMQKALPAIYANLDGHRALIGPLVVPEQTSCYSCYTHRLAPNLRFVEEAAANQRHKGNLASSQTLPSLYALEASFHVISQILKFYNDASHLCLLNEMLDIDLIDYELNIRPVMRVPRCPKCYSTEFNAPRPAIRNLI